MVSTDKLFKRLVAVDTLIKFDAVIPSQSEFIKQITTSVNALYQAFCTENKPQLPSQICCALLCLYFNTAFIRSQRQQGIHCTAARLLTAASEYFADVHSTPLQQQLTDLLNTEDDDLFIYGWQLLELFIIQNGQTDTLLHIHTNHQQHYYKLCLSCNSPHSAPDTASDLTGFKAQVIPLYILIVGPFAQKWFAEQENSIRGEVVWRVCPAPSQINHLIEQWKEFHPEKQLTLFFPIMVDALQSTSLLNNEISKWQNLLSNTALPMQQPCLLAFYTRLSVKDQNHNHDQVIWCGQLNCNDKTKLTVGGSLADLIDNIMNNSSEVSSLCSMQQAAMASLLEQWLSEEGTLSLLQSMFDSGRFSFSSMIIADYGQGFTRHGAWSNWIEQNYALLPGLGASIFAPPLPQVIPPVRLVPVQAVEPLPLAIEMAIAQPASPSSRWRWPWLVLIILIALLLIASVAYWVASTPNPRSSVSTQTIRENNQLLPLADAMPLFNPGQNTLSAQSTDILNKLAQRIEQLPANAVLLIIGHSDNTGSEKLNKDLSLQRAKIIRDWLIKNYHLPEQRLIIEGKGDTQPIDSNETKTGRARNRRVEIIPLINQYERK